VESSLPSTHIHPVSWAFVGPTTFFVNSAWSSEKKILWPCPSLFNKNWFVQRLTQSVCVFSWTEGPRFKSSEVSQSLIFIYYESTKLLLL
jgi:hypothetical protein